MARISVVVPIYNVEPYLSACLESIAAQTFGDLDVVMVDDGSTDSSAAIAEAFAARDPRFRLIRQANGGLSRARNTGLDAAEAEFLSFVDSDDALPPDAYELLVGALDATGSDFATGNVHRLHLGHTRQSPFLAKAFARTRLKTHVTRFRALLADRTAWNKLWRRSFWDRHGLRFPEGVVHEDIPVILPAHFLARSVDVIADPVYLYRIREGGELSITQRRLEQRVLLDRVAAVEHVSDFLGRNGPPKARQWYHASVVADDLRYHLNVLESADDAYRALFLERVNAFLDRVERGAYAELPAIERLKWHLVRRRLMPELLEVLRFQREDLSETPPVRVRGRWYGDYPFRTDRRLRIPRAVYRLGSELVLRAGIDGLRFEGARLEVDGYAYIDGIGAPGRDSQRVTVTALQRGRLRPVRIRLTPLRARASAARRPDVTAATRRATVDPSWSGFRASFDLRRLLLGRRSTEGTWELYVTVRVGALTRRGARFRLDGPRPVRSVEHRPSDGLLVRAAPTRRRVVVETRTRWARIHDAAVADGALVLSGELRADAGGRLRLEVVDRDGLRKERYPATVEGAGARAAFTARVPLTHLLARGEPAGQDPERAVRRRSELWLVAGAERLRLALPDEVPEAAWPCAGAEIALFRTRQGDAAVVARPPRPVISGARWTDDGALEVDGEPRSGAAPAALVLRARETGEEHAFPVLAQAGGRFSARLTAAHIESLAGSLPMPEGTWDVVARPAGADGAADVPAMVSQALYGALPLATVVEHKPFELGATGDRRAVLAVRRDLDEDEQGRFHERRLRRSVYAARRTQPLRDAVVYSSFRGRQFSDSPRAIHEELVRRDAPLEHLWMVRDARAAVPPTATVLRDGSREFHDALARARYVVFNDHFPEWFVRRPDQVCLQTWHGTPLKRLGFDASEMQRTIRLFERRWGEQVLNWQHVVSPNRFTTPILRRAYGIEGDVIETGYPRDDMLAGPDRDVRGRALRARLGLPADARVVLYAPTYRDHIVDARGRYRLDLRLDLERLRRAVGSDTVILVRKHHYIVDPVPVTADGFVRDVSSFPDGTELLLAADVLVTDYSSMMFDFANTGRPMLFYTYDLDTYRDEIRGFYFDFVGQAPGPLLGTTDEVAAALNDLDAVRADYAGRYAAFASTFCELDDGHASARVVDRVFEW